LLVFFTEDGSSSTVDVCAEIEMFVRRISVFRSDDESVRVTVVSARSIGV
jgi:hypothetical protein